MVPQKDLIAESGLKEDAAVTVLKRLRRKGEITAEKDRFHHNQISYSTEDADKIRQEFAQVKEAREKSAKEGSPEIEKNQKKDDQAKPKGGPPSTKDTSVKDFVKEPGPEKTATKTEGKDKQEEKAVPLYKNPIVYIGAGLLLLLGLMWLYQQRLKKQQAESRQQVESRTAESPPPSAAARPALADQYRIM